MEIRDVIHGTLDITDYQERILESPFFQRLRNIKQLGFAENSFPGATHNRFTHSVGASYLAEVSFRRAFRENNPISSKKFNKFLAAVKTAALLHDIGHGPLSHTTEFAMPDVRKLELGLLTCKKGEYCPFDVKRQANHEDYTIKIVLQSSLTPVLLKALSKYKIEPIHIACIINSDILCPDDFFVDQGIDYRPILHQFVSSEIDVDRMDYLTRDTYYCGVNYGKFDLEWIINNVTHHIQKNKCYLTLSHKAIFTFDDFLISRLHMFLMVYFHHKSVIFDEMLTRYLKSEDCKYEIPSDIEAYVMYDDYHLYNHLSTSSNGWAKRVYYKNPYKVIAEFHSGIPTGEENARVQKATIEKIVSGLKSKGVDYILKTTTGELSKYFKKEDRDPIFVKYDNRFGPVRYIPLEDCTDLFEKYSKNRSITRIYGPN